MSVAHIQTYTDLKKKNPGFLFKLCFLVFLCLEFVSS